NPNRWRPLFWDEGDSTRCSWERPVSTYNTAFSYIGQMRDWLPDEVGGICWFGVDDTYFTCYIPVYVGVTSIPEPFTIGDINKYDPASMWWAFNFVSNFANLKYSYMIKDVQKVQSRLEDQMISEQDSITKLTISLAEEERSGMLTSYSQRCGAMVHQEWQELGNLLVTRYNDGYVKDEENHIREAGYPSEWMEEMNRIHPDKYRIPDWNKENRQ
nr:C69 family dipeptidase [Bacteroidota bacterium]